VSHCGFSRFKAIVSRYRGSLLAAPPIREQECNLPTSISLINVISDPTLSINPLSYPFPYRSKNIARARRAY
jgi:hypothetical protein